MNMSRLTQLTLMTLAALSATYAQAQDVILGSVTLPRETSGPMPGSLISTTLCHVNAIRLQVQGADANLDRLRLRFRDGTVQPILLRTHLNAPTTSGLIAVNGGNRCIDQVVVVGATARVNHRPGLSMIQIIASVQPQISPVVRIGSTETAPFTTTLDVNGLALTSLQLSMRYGSASIRAVTVQYMDGTIQQLDLTPFTGGNPGIILMAGRPSQLMDLAGAIRNVDKVTISGQMLENIQDGMVPAIEVLGRHQL